MDKKNKTAWEANWILYMFLASVGCFLVYVGTEWTQAPPWLKFLSSIGNVLIATGTALFLGVVLNKDPVKKAQEIIGDMVTKVLKAPWRSAEVPNYLCTEFHGYLRAEDENGTPIWIYRKFDFTASSTPGQLETTVTYKGVLGQESAYRYVGFVADRKTIVLVGQNLKSAEAPVIQVFPAEVHSGWPLAGLAFFHNAFRHDLVSSTMLSKRELTEHIYEQGPIRDKETNQKLDQKWKSAVSPWQLWMP
jgi:hypothetical protein